MASLADCIRKLNLNEADLVELNVYKKDIVEGKERTTISEAGLNQEALSAMLSVRLNKAETEVNEVKGQIEGQLAPSERPVRGAGKTFEVEKPSLY